MTLTNSILSGKVARLYVFDFGQFEVSEDGRQIGIPGYLIQTQDEKNILVDTGFPARYATEPEAVAAEDNLGSFGRVLGLTEENLPPAQLAKVGLEPKDIDFLILTHSDIDHVGGIADFPGVPIVMSEAEKAQPRPRYFDGRSPIEWPENVVYRLISEDIELVPGLALLLVPGHAPGQLALLLELPETGAVLITGDAISRPAEFEEGFGGAWDEAQARQSAQRLMEIAKEERAW